jgi:hypothetical protein
MMLVSTALMYYYFQRTRFLEREVLAIKNGETPEKSGFASLLPWTDSAPTTSAPSSDALAISESPATLSPAPVAIQQTPTAAAGVQPRTQEADTLSPSAEAALANETSNGLVLQQLPAQTANDSQAEATGQPVEPESQQPAESGAQINSMYDTQAPPVRVRSPSRNRR